MIQTLEVGAPIAGKYRVMRVLGAGAMGVVYKAQHELIPTHVVAVKVLQPEAADDPDLVRRFRQEAMALAALNSPHIVRLLDFGYTTQETPYLVMEFADGISLGDLIRRRGRLTEEEALRYAAHIAEALVEAHDAGVVHRDLKPDNIFLVTPPGSGEQIARVLDFGIAKIVGDTRLDPISRTRAGQVLCTPEYGAPEVFYGAPERVSDIYSLGIVIIEMLAGEVPYTGPNPTIIAAKHVEETPVPLPNVTLPGFGDIIGFCVNKNPRERFRSAEAVRNALRSVSTAPKPQAQTIAATLEMPVVDAEEAKRPSVVSLAGLMQQPHGRERAKPGRSRRRDSRAIAALQAFTPMQPVARPGPMAPADLDSSVIVPRPPELRDRLAASAEPGSWEAIEAHPSSPEAYRARYRGLRDKDPDAAFLALGSLVALGAAEDHERAHHQAWRDSMPRGLGRHVTGTELARLEPPVNPHLRRIFALVGACAIDDILLVEQGGVQPLRHDSLVTDTRQWAMLPFFLQAAAALGVSPPSFHVARDVRGVRLLHMAPPTVAISADVLATPASRSWLFSAGHVLAGLIAPYRLTAMAPSVRFVEEWFSAVAQVATQPTGVVEASGTLRARALIRLPDEVIEDLRASFLGLLRGTEVVDIAAWVAHVETTLDRLGLLVSGDVATVAKRMRGLRRLSRLTREARLADLVQYNASPTHADLRRRLGMVVR